MPPKVNPAELKISNNFPHYWLKTFSFFLVQVKVFGGEAGPASTLAPKLGPLGLVNHSFPPFDFYQLLSTLEC